MIPVRLEMKNFRSHTHSVLDFDFNSALLVGETDGDARASNGSGKSSIFEAICWALFGKAGARDADNVIKWGSINCEVVFDFKHEDHSYRIIRNRTIKGSKMVTEFYQLPEDRPLDRELDKRHGDTNSLTNAEISKVISSSYDVFLNSSYFRQNSFFEFAQGRVSTRQGVLNSLLNLKGWNKYQADAKSEFTEHSRKIKNIQQDIERTEKAEENLANTKAKLADAKAKVVLLSQNNSILEEEISSLEDKIAQDDKSDRDVYRFNELSGDAAKLERELREVEEKQGNVFDSQKSAEADLKKNEKASAIISEDLENLRARIAATTLDAMNEKIAQMEPAILEGKAKRRVLQSQITNLREHEECDMCGHRWQDAAAKRQAILEKVDELDQVMGKLDRAENKLATSRNIRDARLSELVEIGKMESRKMSIANNIESCNSKLVRLKKEQAHLVEHQESLMERLGNIRGSLKGLQHVKQLDVNSNIETVILNKKAQLKKNSVTISELSFEQGRLAANEKTFKEQVKEHNAAVENLAVETKGATIFGRLTKVFGRDGVQAIIIDNVMEDLTRITNQWLTEFCAEPFYVNFITQAKDTKGDWKETIDIEISTPTGTSDFSSLSGGEQFRVSFAIRLALSSLQSRRMGGETQMLLLDEVSTSLDETGLEMFVSIIKKLERSMKVMVITHDNKLKDEFDNIITIKNTSQGSSIEAKNVK